MYLKIFIILEYYFNYLFKSCDSLTAYIQHYRDKSTHFVIDQYFVNNSLRKFLEKKKLFEITSEIIN